MSMLLRWEDIETSDPNAPVAKRRLAGGGASLVRVAIKAGVSADRHSHPFEQFVQVISGRGILETAEGTSAFEAGSLFHFPPNAWHAARFEEDTVLVETNLAPS